MQNLKQLSQKLHDESVVMSEGEKVFNSALASFPRFDYATVPC